MADIKPKAKTESSSPNFAIALGGVLAVLFFLGILWARVESALDVSDSGSFLVRYFHSHIWPVVKVFAFIVSITAIYGISYNYKRLNALAKGEREIYAPKAMSPEGVEEGAKNERWERVLEHINSANSADWRLAIIESDIMLDELLTASGYHGDSVGAKLKSVEKSDFLTLESAWEAHKVRNDIAHRGASFELTERDAKRAVSLFEAVFREFNII
ncbi:MAG: hypothetical protein WD874_01135 [Parcubacteria group bacterium]